MGSGFGALGLPGLKFLGLRVKVGTGSCENRAQTPACTDPAPVPKLIIVEIRDPAWHGCWGASS